MNYQVKGIIFDMDGVIVRQRLDFAAIKQEIFGNTEGFILERMSSLAGEALARAEAILERHEAAAALEAEPLDGAVQFLGWMEEAGLRRGLVTRNNRRSVRTVLERLGLRFEAVVTREDAPPKPSPEPIWLACRRLDLSTAEVLFVGDFEFDMLAGRRAGVWTVLLRNPVQPDSAYADHVIDGFEDLRRLLAPRRSPPNPPPIRRFP